MSIFDAICLARAGDGLDRSPFAKACAASALSWASASAELLVGLFANTVEHGALESLALRAEAIALFAGLKAKAAHLRVEFVTFGGEASSWRRSASSFEPSMALSRALRTERDHRTEDQRAGKQNETQLRTGAELNPDRAVEVDDGALRQAGR